MSTFKEFEFRKFNKDIQRAKLYIYGKSLYFHEHDRKNSHILYGEWRMLRLDKTLVRAFLWKFLFGRLFLYIFFVELLLYIASTLTIWDPKGIEKFVRDNGCSR